MVSHSGTLVMGVLVMALCHPGNSVRLEGLSLDDVQEEAETVVQQANPAREARKAARQQECSSAVANASLVKRRTCGCPENTVVVCPNEACNTYQGTFKLKEAEALKETPGCECKVCDTSCESVPGASRRPTVWGRMWGRDCACEKGWKLAGSDEACLKSRGKSRYFSSKNVIDRGCSCSFPEEEGEGAEEEESEEATVAAVPEEPESDEEEPEEEPEEDEEDEAVPEEEQPEEEQPEEEEPADDAVDPMVSMLPVNHSDLKEEDVAPPSASGNLLEDIKKPDSVKAVMFGLGVLVLGGGCVTLVVCIFRGGNGEDLADEDH